MTQFIMHLQLLMLGIGIITTNIMSLPESPAICSLVPEGTSSVFSCKKEHHFGNCLISGDKNEDVGMFQEYREGDEVISGCPSEWRFNNVRHGLEEWIKIMSLDKDPFWMMDDSKYHDVPLLQKRGKEHLQLLPLKGYFRLGLVYKDNHLQFLSPDQKDETTVYFDNKLQSILERCPFEGIVHPKSVPGASYHLLPMSKNHPLPLFMEGRTRAGIIQGPVRIFGKHVSETECHAQIYPQLAFIGSYRNNKPHGYCWKGLKGGAWLYGKVDENGEFTGDNIAYIYQDLSTALLGQFRGGVMVAAREVEVRGYRCQGGIARIKFSKPTGNVFHYKPPTSRSFGDQPKATDPLDNKYVYLAPSIEMPFAGEGIFAVRDIPPYTTISLYSGIRKNYTTANHDHKMYLQKLLKKRGLSLIITGVKLRTLLAQKAESFKNLLQVNYHCDLVIDIPPRHISTYKATLGHKTNHKFHPHNNVEITWVDSARFGAVAALTSIKWIKKGEKIFNDYKYDLKDTTLPWYKETYMKLIHEKESRTIQF